VSDLDFSLPVGGPAEIVATEESARHRFETWRLTGSAGDEVLADAYLPAEPRLIVLAGHGKENSRQAQYVRGPGMLWARRWIATVAIDAPLHGDRAGERPVPEITSADADLLTRWVRDQRLLLDAVLHRFGDGVPVAFMGVSMGGVFGTHLAAAEPRLAAVVCVVAGSTAVSVPQRWEVDAATREVLARLDPAVAAPQVGCPALMVNADADEIFSTHSALALYDAFESPKEITIFPGRHAEWRSPHQWYRRIEGFLIDAALDGP
jgi:pimeloyl-ACP methyl ester carboxylesterase